MTALDAPRTARALPLWIVTILVLAPIAYGLLAVAMGQDANWDLKNYHWYNGYALVTGRYFSHLFNDGFGLDIVPSQTPFFYNPALDGLFYLLGSRLPAQLVAFCMGLLQGINFILLFLIARRIQSPAAPRRNQYAALAAALAVVGGGTLAELGACFYDNVLSLGIFASALIALVVLQDKRALRLLLVAGIPMGIVIGLKLPAATFAVGLCAALLLTGGTLMERFLRALTFGIGVTAGLLISYAPWGWYLWTHFHNPLFPYFNNVFHSPVTLPTSARDTQFVANGWHKLTFPFDWTLNPLLVGEVPFRDLKLPILYILLPLALLVAPFRRRVVAGSATTAPHAAYIVWALGIAYVAWLAVFCIYRYAVPLEMLAAPALLVALDKFGLPGKAQRIAFLLIAIVVLATTIVGNWGRTDYSARYVQMDVPAFPNPEKTMLLMGGFQPYSHVIPSFPAAMPVVRVQSNFASPEEPKGVNQIIDARIRYWQGDFMLLLPVYDMPWVSEKVMPQFGLKTLLDDCQRLHPNFNEDFLLCKVVRQ